MIMVEKPREMSPKHVMLENDMWTDEHKSRDRHWTSDHPPAYQTRERVINAPTYQ